VNIATSIETMSGTLASTTNAPAMRASPPNTSSSVTNHAVPIGHGTPTCASSFPKPAGPLDHLVTP
jgi:hypothetical protein